MVVVVAAAVMVVVVVVVVVCELRPEPLADESGATR